MLCSKSEVLRLIHIYNDLIVQTGLPGKSSDICWWKYCLGQYSHAKFIEKSVQIWMDIIKLRTKKLVICGFVKNSYKVKIAKWQESITMLVVFLLGFHRMTLFKYSKLCDVWMILILIGFILEIQLYPCLSPDHTNLMI